ncbi:His Kinase A (phospho-acceptor) domain-containing protein [Chryseolinea serpens]|uniref:histidine kinase n=2 Tax=Chryseolinea serpens TaxID=947013 RepID=A0A1M5X9L1_9BACT|nr:His Kinase A (phospho-acceptor) domain-containing protein [Chryseolinea serpens]
MASSIALMVVLQGLWLRSSYEKAYLDFRRETNYIFRNTLFTMRDSLMAKRIQPIGSMADTATVAVGGHLERTGHFSDMPDTGLIRKMKVVGKGRDIQIFITSDGSPDSIKNFVSPLTDKIQNTPGRHNYFIRFGQDTLNLDTIAYRYNIALSKAGIAVPFQVKFVATRRPSLFPLEDRPSGRKNDDDENNYRRPRFLRDTLVSDYVHVNPTDRYAASFPNISRMLLGQITPQILFSVFLTGMTCLAFFVMYRSMRAQRQLVQLKNDFISNITHELKTPVATVSVALEAVRNFQAKNNPQLTAEYLDIAQSELNRLSGMTDKIMENSILESEGAQLPRATFDFDEMLQQVLASMKPVFERRSATVQYIKDGTDFILDGVAVNLSYMVYNFLDNALKYSPQKPKIEVTLKKRGASLVLTVRDEGVGIDQGYQKKIFEKFFRVPTGNIHNTKGYGLGLSYVANVVKSHHGNIEVESEPGKGSTFKVTLPRN